MDRHQLTEKITNFTAITGEAAITPQVLGELLSDMSATDAEEIAAVRTEATKDVDKSLKNVLESMVPVVHIDRVESDVSLLEGVPEGYTLLDDSTGYNPQIVLMKRDNRFYGYSGQLYFKTFPHSQEFFGEQAEEGGVFGKRNVIYSVQPNTPFSGEPDIYMLAATGYYDPDTGSRTSGYELRSVHDVFLNWLPFDRFDTEIVANAATTVPADLQFVNDFAPAGSEIVYADRDHRFYGHKDGVYYSGFDGSLRYGENGGRGRRPIPGQGYVLRRNDGPWTLYNGVDAGGYYSIRAINECNFTDDEKSKLERLGATGGYYAFDGAYCNSFDERMQAKAGLYLHLDDDLSINGVYLSRSNNPGWLRFPIDIDEGVNDILAMDPRVELKDGVWVLKPNSLFYIDTLQEYNSNGVLVGRTFFGQFYVTDKNGTLSETGMLDVITLQNTVAAMQRKLNELPTAEELAEQIAAAGGGDCIVTALGGVGADAAGDYCKTKEFVRSDGPRIVVYNVPQNNGSAPVAGLIYSSPYYSNACWQLRLNGKTLEWRNITYTESTPRVGGWSKNVFTFEKPVNNGNASLRLKFAPSGETICEAQNFADITALEGKVDKVSGKGLSTHDFDNTWMNRLANADVYGRMSGNKLAVNGIFSLPKYVAQYPDMKHEDQAVALAHSNLVKEALTSSDGVTLTEDDLAYCADNGVMLFDEATNGFVQVTRGAGADSTIFNFVEISIQRVGADAASTLELPKLRTVTITSALRSDIEDITTATAADYRFKVGRAGMEERLCYYSELQVLAARVTALENK